MLCNAVFKLPQLRKVTVVCLCDSFDLDQDPKCRSRCVMQASELQEGFG